MAVATGIPPDTLLELDGLLFDELEKALDERWSPELELAAATLETTHALLRAFYAVNSKKGARALPVLVIPRPGAPAELEPSGDGGHVSPSGFAALMGRRHVSGVDEGGG